MRLGTWGRHARDAGPLARVVAWAAGAVTIGEPVRMFTALGRHRRLFRAWLPFAATLLLRPRLPRADVETVILRTACNCSCAYEWTQHVQLARRAGLAERTISAIAERGDEHALGLRRRLLLDAVDELSAKRRISDVTLDQLRRLYDEEQLIELCMLSGHYTMLAMTLANLGVTPEPSALAALGAAQRRTAVRLSGPPQP